MVFVVKYRKDLLTDEVSKYLKEVLLAIGKRYYLWFHAMGTDEDHLHILVEAAPRYSPSQIMISSGAKTPGVAPGSLYAPNAC